MTVTILVPMLGRAHNVAPLLKSITDSTPEPHSVLFLCTAGDREVLDTVVASGALHMVVNPRGRGDYAHKIHAGIGATATPYIFTGAGDLRFHRGWLPAALAPMSTTIGVVGTQDMCNPRVILGKHATHFLVARWYVTEFGTIDRRGHLFHEGYWHECVDDELIGTARARGAYAFAADSIVEHLHPLAGKAPMDDLYAQQRHRLHFGRHLFRQREPLWTSR